MNRKTVNSHQGGTARTMVETLADLSVRRMCMFAMAGILLAMYWFSLDMVLSTKVGCGLSAFIVVTLLGNGWLAPIIDVKQTQAWRLLPEVHRPPAHLAQQTVGGALQRAYIKFADIMAGLTIGLYLSSLHIRGLV